MKKIALIVFICVVAGCRTQSLPPAVMPQTHTENHATQNDHTTNKRDSVVVRDSVVIREKGDTIYLYKNHTEYRWREIHDTIRTTDSVMVCDSVPYPVEVEKPVPYVPNYYKNTSKGFWILLALLVVFVGGKIAKAYLKTQTGGIL